MNFDVLLDASALLCWLLEQTGCDVVEPYLSPDSAVVSVNLGEVLYKSQAAGDDATFLLDDVAALGVNVVELGAQHIRHFPFLKALENRDKNARAGKRRAALSLADMCCLSVAIETGATVLTGDRHWKQLGLDIEIVEYQS